MGEQSSIQWTTHTLNPWIGCAKVSAGCKNCYAEVNTFARRSRAKGLELWGERSERHVTSDAIWRQPLSWNRKAKEAGERHRVFCASLADVAEIPEREDMRLKLADARERLWDLIEECDALDWLLLTKRPENLSKVLPPDWLRQPRKNVWLLTTAENQEQAGIRIPELLKVPAAVHGVSAEPLLGAINFSSVEMPDGDTLGRGLFSHMTGSGIDWVIVGGESGHSARPFHVEWARSIVEQCRVAGSAAFVKQLGARPVIGKAVLADWPDGVRFMGDGEAKRGRVLLADRKGGDVNEWASDLRVRMMPGDKWPSAEAA